MAKKASKAGTQSSEQPAGVLAMTAAENKIDEFAEDLGRLLGTARAKAEDWLGQRKAILEHLSRPAPTKFAAIDGSGRTDPRNASRSRRSYTRMLWTCLKRKAAYLPG